ncbi:MAG: hypothetical protein ACQESK_09155 [Bacteroidota bacterium]
MRSITKLLAVLFLFVFAHSAFAQKRDLDNYRLPDQRGIDVFETPKDTATTFDGVHVRVGGASTLQFQAIDHSNSGTPLAELENNFNLATANLDLDVVLYDGVRMHLRTYLSSRHHPEPYVKGGYFQIDKLEFIKEGFMEDLMKYVTIKFGHMENNYGDAHFRRTDNAQAMYNPFIGNYLMDSFTTEVGGEVYYRRNGWIFMVGATNGKLNQTVVDVPTSPSVIGKVGYDKQINDDLRTRLTASVYNTAQSSNNYLYAGDRAGSRYYFVMEGPDASSAGNFRSGRINPALNRKLTAFMVNPYVKYKNFEFFGVIENSSGVTTGETERRDWNHFAGELLYRFGTNDNFYAGARYSYVDGEQPGGNNVEIDRLQLGAGWFMTKNILTKIEYVNQNYSGYAPGDILHDGQFDGISVEAVISF